MAENGMELAPIELDKCSGTELLVELQPKCF